MFFPRKTSTRKKLIIEALVSLASLLAIHAAVIAIHMYVDDATPASPVAYAVDRALESLEEAMPIRSDISRIKMHLHHAEERMDEMEHMVTDEENVASASQDPLDRKTMQTLLENCTFSLERATKNLSRLVRDDDKSISSFTVALLAESTVRDTSRRLERLQEEFPEGDGRETIKELAFATNSLLQQCETISAQFRVEEVVAAQIRADVERSVGVLPERTRSALPADSIGTTCGSSGASCDTNIDCCVSLGFTCMDAILSDGQRGKRCQRSTALLCNIVCASSGSENTDGRWGNAYGCHQETLPPDIPDCDRIEGKECQLSKNSQRNVRVCKDT